MACQSSQSNDRPQMNQAMKRQPFKAALHAYNRKVTHMAKKTKEPTSKGIIKDLLSKAWQKAKDLPRKLRGTKADVEAKERKRIAEKTGRSSKQIRDIEQGKRPGRNLFEPLKKLKRGRKPEAPPKEEKKVKARKKPPAEKPPAEKPKKEPEKKPAAPEMPNGLKVKIKGEIAPFKGKEDKNEYVRSRTITTTLQGDALRDFMKLWTSGNEKKALEYATAIYFGATAKEIQQKAGEVFTGYMPEFPEEYSFADPITQEPIDI